MLWLLLESSLFSKSGLQVYPRGSQQATKKSASLSLVPQSKAGSAAEER